MGEWLTPPAIAVSGEGTIDSDGPMSNYFMEPPIARFMGPTWGPSGADKTQVGPMLAPWTLLSGDILVSLVSSWPHGHWESRAYTSTRESTPNHKLILSRKTYLMGNACLFLSNLLSFSNALLVKSLCVILSNDEIRHTPQLANISVYSVVWHSSNSFRYCLNNDVNLFYNYYLEIKSGFCTVRKISRWYPFNYHVFRIPSNLLAVNHKPYHVIISVYVTNTVFI